MKRFADPNVIVGVAGLAITIAGAALWSVRMAVVVAGVLLMATALFVDLE